MATQAVVMVVSAVRGASEMGTAVVVVEQIVVAGGAGGGGSGGDA